MGAVKLGVMLVLGGSAPVYPGRRRVIAAWPAVNAAAAARLTWWLPGAWRRADAPLWPQGEACVPSVTGQQPLADLNQP